MKKITVTIDEIQDQDIRDIQIEKAKGGEFWNYSKVMRKVIDEGLKKF